MQLHIFLECLSKYEVYPQIGLTLIRNEENGEETETVLFEDEIVLLQIFPYF